MGRVKEKYTKDYFLGNKSKIGYTYGVAGFHSFAKGVIDSRYLIMFPWLDCKGKFILDIGCGRGEVVGICASRGASLVVGMDFSEESIEICRARLRNYKTVQLIRSEATELCEHNKFDVVFMLDTIEHIPSYEMEVVYEKIMTSLKLGGLFIFNTPIFNQSNFKDMADIIPELQGMHCNKQTSQSLSESCSKHGFLVFLPWIWKKKGRLENMTMTEKIRLLALKMIWSCTQVKPRTCAPTSHIIDILWVFLSGIIIPLPGLNRYIDILVARTRK